MQQLITVRTRKRQGVEVVADKHHGEPQALLQVQDEMIHLLGEQRIQARYELVQKQKFGIEGNRRARAARLIIPPDKASGNIAARLWCQPDRGDLQIGQSLSHPERLVGVLDQRSAYVLADCQARKQGPDLEHSPPTADGSYLFRWHNHRDRRRRRGSSPRRRFQPDEGAQQDRLAGPGGSDDAEDFSKPDAQVEMIQDDGGTEAGDQTLDLNHRALAHVFGVHRDILGRRSPVWLGRRPMPDRGPMP